MQADREFVRSLSSEAFAAFGDYSELLPRWLEAPGVISYVATTARRAHGFVMLGFYYADREQRWTYADVLALAVVRELRQRGLGERLLRRAIEAATEARRLLDVREVRLTVADSNTAAMRLFAREGFLPCEQDRGRYDGGQRAMRLSRPLA